MASPANLRKWEQTLEHYAPIEKKLGTFDFCVAQPGLGSTSMEVKFISNLGEEYTWCISKALLSHHSGYFQRACQSNTFIEGQANKIVVPEFDPDVFKMFDDLSDHFRVRDSAKAWVLGDYLDAVEFKNFAIRHLYDLYIPPPGPGNRPKTGIDPEMVSYCCSKTASGSRLYRLVTAFLVQNWHRNNIVHYHRDNRQSWDQIWVGHRGIVSDMLFYTQEEMSTRFSYERNIVSFLEKSTDTDESAASANESD
ncbi:hypothetical protein PMIN01_02524 [Paraphaeosphaeria minitans]|uniref:BTB domain-containing protein n=1 Tax=Paraphaeosphaeria minitans TaxID=565426 RepID=A0A9P6GQV8_9PLEO|nr:hypothetical protein PMIN01_02524 [Paraphaeosphaeria minitans]